MNKLSQNKVSRRSALGWATAAVAAGLTAPAVGAPARANTNPNPMPRKVGAKISYNTAYEGQCTWWAKHKWAEAMGYYPNFRGDAKDWHTTAAQAGWTVAANAESKSIVVFQPGIYGANERYGHVGWVTYVEYRSDDTRWIHYTEMNYGAGAGVTRDNGPIQDIAGMSYILAPWS